LLYQIIKNTNYEKVRKNKSRKKADLALCKLEDIFYIDGITDRIATRLNNACDSIRELISEIENTETK